MKDLNASISIYTCRNHHVVLRHLIGELPRSAPPDEHTAVSLLHRLKRVMSTHLALEDRTVYPLLECSSDDALRSKAVSYKRAMGSLAHAFAEFYARWTEEGAVSRDGSLFLTQWDEMRSALDARMDAEDNDLYKIAEKTYQRSMIAPILEAGE